METRLCPAELSFCYLTPLSHSAWRKPLARSQHRLCVLRLPTFPTLADLDINLGHSSSPTQISLVPSPVIFANQRLAPAISHHGNPRHHALADPALFGPADARCICLQSQSGLVAPPSPCSKSSDRLPSRSCCRARDPPIWRALSLHKQGCARALSSTPHPHPSKNN